MQGRLAAFGATLIWGFNYVIAKSVLTEIDPLAVAWVRAATAGALFPLILLLREGRLSLSWSDLRRALPPGLMGIFANQILFVEGLQRTTPAHAAILIALVPVHVLLLSVICRQERLSLSRAGGVLVAFTGVALVALEEGLDLHAGTLAGDLLVLAGGIGFAGYTVMGKPLLRDLGSLRTTALCFMAGGAGTVLVAAPATVRQDWGAVSSASLLGLSYIVLAATIGSYLLYSYALARIDPSQVAVFAYLQPLIAALVSFAVAGDRLTASLVVGGCLVLAGVAIAERT